MDDHQFEQWETFIRNTAEHFPYPLTPNIVLKIGDIASAVKEDNRRLRSNFLVRTGMIATVLILILLSVPSVRAAVINLMQVGVARIFYRESAPTPTLNGHSNQNSQVASTPTLVYTLRDMAGETTLEKAASQVPFQISIPTYPEGLEKPDHVYLPSVDREMIVFLWLEPDDNEQIMMSLMQLGSDVSIGKEVYYQVTETTVSNRPAIWIEEPHILWMDLETNQLFNAPIYIQSSVLIWQEEGITYRLETQTTLSEAIKTAESLVPLP
jgi:hypothetical protein